MRDGDQEAFLYSFTDDAVATDDGRPVSLRSWVERELFTSHGTFDLERELEEGRRLLGQFRSDNWQMPVFWDLEIQDGKVSRFAVGRR